jgi:2-dehydro-3-deoxygluconokinase
LENIDHGRLVVIDVLSFGEPLVGFYPPHGASMAEDVPIVKTWGGDTSNLAIGIARLGRTSRFLTRVGNDPFGRGFIELWQRNGVDTSLVGIDDDRRTGLYFVSFEGRKHVLTYYRKDSAASAIQETDITVEMVQDCAIVHLTGISLGMSESAVAAGKRLVKLAREYKKMVSFDINYRILQWKSAQFASDTITSVIGTGVDILEITDDEMLTLGWGDDPRSLWERFPESGIIILKQGPKGATVMTKTETFVIPACPVVVQDTVGAGDSFDAGFIVSLLEGKSVKEAAYFATANAAHTCTGTGPLEKMPTHRETDLLLASWNRS